MSVEYSSWASFCCFFGHRIWMRMRPCMRGWQNCCDYCTLQADVDLCASMPCAWLWAMSRQHTTCRCIATYTRSWLKLSTSMYFYTIPVLCFSSFRWLYLARKCIIEQCWEILPVEHLNALFSPGYSALGCICLKDSKIYCRILPVRGLKECYRAMCN